MPSKLSTTQGKWALTHAAVLYFHTAFAIFTRQPRMKLYRNSTTSGSNQHPSLLRGMQLTCGLQDFMMSLHHQTDGQIARWRPGPTKAAFHPSIHRSIDRSSTPGPATSPCKSFWDYNGLLQVTLQQSTLHAGWISQHLFKWQT